MSTINQGPGPATAVQVKCPPSATYAIMAGCKCMKDLSSGKIYDDCPINTETYNELQEVCSDQATYNRAFRAALKYNMKQNMKEAKPYIWVYVAIYLIFFVWALSLASQVQPGPYRTMHMMLALLVSPVYVLAHYIGMLNTK